MAQQIEEFILGSFGPDVQVQYTVREAGTVLDISAATSLVFQLVTPRKEIIQKTASFYTDGTDGILKYAWIEGDLPRNRKDLVGTWEVQPEFVLSNFTGPLKAGQFVVTDCVRKT